MVLIVGVGHLLALLRAPMRPSASQSCEQKRLRHSGISFALQYEVCSHYRVKHLTEWDAAMNEALKIGELSDRTGCPVETIRYYEHEALLPAPVRSNANYRLYGKAHVERLSFIRHCRSLDMALEEIRTLLRFRDSPQENCDGANQLLDQHIGHVADRIAELNMLARQLKSLRRQCGEAKAARDCGILNKLGETKTGKATPSGGISGHVRGSHR
jgi:Cd(II)/Pb(II)-responsive transcriptional regulator